MTILHTYLIGEMHDQIKVILSWFAILYKAKMRLSCGQVHPGSLCELDGLTLKDIGHIVTLFFTQFSLEKAHLLVKDRILCLERFKKLEQ